MSKLLPLALSSIAVAVLAGCATEDRVAPAPAPVVVHPQAVTPAPVVVAPAAPMVVTPAPTVVTPATPSAVVVPQVPAGAIVVAPVAPGPLRVGIGYIESITPIAPAAAAGSTVPSANKRIGVRMTNDAALQYLDTAATNLALGDRVEITADGYMRRP